MRFQPLIRRIGLVPVLAAGLGVVLGGCGSSGSPAAKTSSSPPASGAAGGGSSASVSAITANWTAFFAASTPVPKRVQLLQNGQDFASVITSQASSPLASSASAKVTGVSGVTATQATVKYSILAGGQTALPNQTGTAVYQDGTWKVGDSSFCGLLKLENGGKSSGLPSACQSAG